MSVLLLALAIPSPAAAHGVQGEVFVNVTVDPPQDLGRCNRGGQFGTCYSVNVYPHPGAIGVPPGTYAAFGHIKSHGGADLSADNTCSFLSPLETGCNTNGQNVPNFAAIPLFQFEVFCFNTHGLLREALVHLGAVVDEHVIDGGCVQGGPKKASSPSGTLFAGETMLAGYYLLDDNSQRYTLEMQGDGNLVIYKPGHVAVWATGTNGNPGAFAVMQADGNFVVYSAGGGPVWATNTVGTANPRLVMQSDCNLVLYGAAGAAWASNTAGC